MLRKRDHVILTAALVSRLFSVSLDAQTAPHIEPADMQRLSGAPWKGSLTYLDYTSKKPISITSTLVVTRADADGRSWRFDYQYPDEPTANSASTVTIDGDGSAIDGERVTERSVLADGIVRIVTEKPGQDDRRPATFRFTYLIGDASFSRRKEVRFEGAADYFERHTYSWTR
jgi:hypothetical protein